jgi:hypothetical protein
MKTAAILLLLLFLLTPGAVAQGNLSPRFQTVYILSMANAMDQHLASRLTSGHVLWVVLQPSSADAVLTDSLGDDFWTWLDRNYPAAGGSAAPEPSVSNVSDYSSPARHRGTIFLVDPRKRLVLWSTYELPKDSSPASLDRSATRICTQLRMAFGKK